MREAAFEAWLEAQGYPKGTNGSYVVYCLRVEKTYGDLDTQSDDPTLEKLVKTIECCTADELVKQPVPPRIVTKGDPAKEVSRFRGALRRYQRFMVDTAVRTRTEAQPNGLTRKDILDAIARCDAAGSVEAFVASLEGLGAPHKFWLLHEGKRYPSKAIVRSSLAEIGSEELPGGSQCKAALDALGFVVIDWRAFIKMRSAFRDWAPDFVDFTQDSGAYWDVERRYKEDLIAKVRAAAKADVPDFEAGEQIAKLLSSGQQGVPLNWRTVDAMRKGDPAVAQQFYAIVGALARSDDDAISAIGEAARAFEALEQAGAKALSRGEVLAFANTVLGTVRPGDACWFKISRVQALGKELFQRKLFSAPRFDEPDLALFLQQMHALYALFERELQWAPKDLFDVQGFVWMAQSNEQTAADEGLESAGDDTEAQTARDGGEEDAQLRAHKPTNLILYGPPGTGKTYRTMAEAVRLCLGLEDSDPLIANPTRRADLRQEYTALKEAGRIGFVTFHQNYAYEDFIEGLRPEALEGGTGFALRPKDGVLKGMAKACLDRPDQGHVLVIDEINRANISKVFGELITLIECDKRLGQTEELTLTLPYSGDVFGVPGNLHLVGTMNTADRSIALLDTALRRRFTFRELMPEPQLLQVVGGIDLAKLLAAINDRIEYLFDREHQIGHAFFWHCTTRAEVNEVMRHAVIPLLAEYFYEDWAKVAAVLGDGHEADGPHEGAFISRAVLPVPAGLGDQGEAAPRYRYKVAEQFSYAGYEAGYGQQ